MPKNLVLVRHGQSEANVALKALKDNGDDSLRKQVYCEKHDSQMRLSNLGIEQAKKSGEWIRKEFPNGFLRYYSSEYIRAQETSAHLSLPNAEWFTDFNLVERSHGLQNLYSPEESKEKLKKWNWLQKREPLYWVPIGGESLAELCRRLRIILDTLHRECSNGDVIIVCHGEVMWAFRILLERMTQEKFKELEENKDPKMRMNNGQVIHYTRINPESGIEEKAYGWMRSVCPNNMDLSRNVWEKIVRPRFTNEELMRRVGAVPRIIN